MKKESFEFFPKERPALNGTWALFWFLPLTGAHHYYMGYQKAGMKRTALLFVWVLVSGLLPYTFPYSHYFINAWLCSVLILVGIWIYDAFTLKKLFVAKWGYQKADWL